MLVEHTPGYVTREKSVKLSDGITDQAAMPENHQRLLRMYAVSRVHCGERKSQRLKAEWIDSTRLLHNPKSHRLSVGKDGVACRRSCLKRGYAPISQSFKADFWKPWQCGLDLVGGIGCAAVISGHIAEPVKEIYHDKVEAAPRFYKLCSKVVFVGPLSLDYDSFSYDMFAVCG